MSLETDIKQWVQLDNRMKVLGDEVKELRTQKNELNKKISSFVEDNNMNHVTVEITGGKLRFAEVKQTQALTIGYIKQCLEESFDELEKYPTRETKLEYLIEYIKQNRSVKYVKDIKRTYDN